MDVSTKNLEHRKLQKFEYWLNDELTKLYHTSAKEYIALLLRDCLSLEAIGVLCMMASLNENENIQSLSADTWKTIRPHPHYTDSQRVSCLQDLWVNGYLVRNSEV